MGPETRAAPMSGRPTRGKASKAAAAAGKGANGIPAAAAAAAEEEGEGSQGSDEESFAEVIGEPTDLSAAKAAQAASNNSSNNISLCDITCSCYRVGGRPEPGPRACWG